MDSNKESLSRLAAAGVMISCLLGVLVGFETTVGTLRLIDISLVLWTFSTLTWGMPLWNTHRWGLAWAAAFFLWILGLTVLQPEIHWSGVAYILRWIVGVYSAWTLSHWLRQQGGTLQRWVDFTCITFIATGIAQYLLLPDARILLWSGWDDHLFRAFGSLLDPLFYGLVCSLLAWRGYRRGARGHWLLAAALIGVTLSYSRLALAATGGWIFLELLQHRSWKRSTLVLALLFTLVLVSPRDGGGEGQKLLRTSSVVARTTTAREDLNSVPGNLLGQGWYIRQPNPQAFAPENARLADSVWLQIWLSGGVIGLVLAGGVVGSFAPRSSLVWWHALGSVVSVLSLSPWVLMASAVLPGETE